VVNEIRAASDAARATNGRVFAVRNNEIFLMSQPRPVRSVHRSDGWTPASVAAHALPALQAQYFARAEHHPLRGALFETLVVNEFLKARWNTGDRSPLYFWRDHVGTEVDLVFERGNALAAVEIKSGITVASDAFHGLRTWRRYAAERGRFGALHLGLAYGGEQRFVREEVDVMPWATL
jgi:hypothetical protein